MTSVARNDLGNRTGDQTLRADGTVNFAVDSTTNRYTSIGGEPIAHDEAGNMTGDKDGYVYFYDYENRIVKIEDDSSSTVATFEYDALGRRIRKVDAVASTTTLYYYDPDWRCLEERDGSDILQRSFIYGNYIDEVLVMTVPGSPPTDYYYLHDHLYSAVALLSSGGSVVERYEYDAYGTVHVMDASYGSRSTSSYGNPYTFTGRRLDLLDSGNLTLIYFRHRAYDAYVGRFLGHDPMGYAETMGLYEYAKGNPIVFTDPMGGCSGDPGGSPTTDTEPICHCFCVDSLGFTITTQPAQPGTLLDGQEWVGARLELTIKGHWKLWPDGQKKPGKVNVKYYEWWLDPPTHLRNIYEGKAAQKWNLIQDVYPIAYPDTEWTWTDSPGHRVSVPTDDKPIEQRAGFAVWAQSKQGCPCPLMWNASAKWLGYRAARDSRLGRVRVPYIGAGRFPRWPVDSLAPPPLPAPGSIIGE